MMTFLYAAPRRLAMAALPLVLLLTLWSVGCGQDSAEPETPGTTVFKSINPDNLYAKSLDQMVSRSDVIVRASLLSATAATEALSGSGGGSRVYRPVHRLRFTVHEYIEGSGPSEILVVVRPRDTHPTEGAARREADRLLSQRNTTWDDRQALLLLIRATRSWYSDWYSIPDVVGGAGNTFAFPRSGNSVQSVWDYSIDTLSRVWLPSNSAEVPADTAAMEFITDGAKTPHPVISLADFRSQKGDLEAMLKAGEGIEGYAECIAGKLAREGHRQANPDWPTPTDEKTLTSGLASGAEVRRQRQERSYVATDYFNYWLTGADMDLFRAVRSDDDSDPKNGYEYALETARPLPAGVYSVRYNSQHWGHIPCNYKPDDSYVAWTVTVTAPGGTLHELFFDPVTVGTAVKANGSNGVLKPASFTDADGAQATIQRIAWESGTAKLEIDPHDGLAGHHLDFIELDGTVSLSLDVADATVDTATGTVSWGVASQPWDDGDELMLRLYEVTETTCSGDVGFGACNADPAFGESTYSFTVAENAALNSLVGTVSATDPDEADTVSYSITAGNGDGKFAIVGGSGEITLAGGLDYETTSSYTLTVEASDGRGGVATVDVEMAVADVAEDLPPAPAGLGVMLADGTFTITWSALAGAAKYEAQHRAGGSDGEWTSLGETLETSATHSPEGGPACGTTYELRVRAYGDGAAYVAGWGPESEPESVTTRACNRAPAFGAATYSFTVAENAALNSAVGTVSATDPDDGETVTYSITAGNGEGKFAIGSGTGELTVAGALDPSVAALYVLTVEASDGRGGTAAAAVNVALMLAGCSNGTAVPRPGQNPKLVRDCSMLLSAKDTLTGDGSLNWSADLLMTRWQGVTVDWVPSLYIRDLILTDVGLTGSIPASLGGLQDLQRLDLDDNTLSGRIPSELGRLGNLRGLFLSNNNLSGEMPPELAGLSNLRFLFLNGNRLTGELPLGLSSLTGLRQLVLDDNVLTGRIPASFGGMTGLEDLWLRYNRLTGSIPSELEDLANLNNLYLEGNEFSGCIPSGLGDVEGHDLGELGLPYCGSDAQ